MATTSNENETRVGRYLPRHPLVLHACRYAWDRSNRDELQRWCSGRVLDDELWLAWPSRVDVDPGDWVIRNAAGEFFRLADADFQRAYVTVSDDDESRKT